MLQSVLTHIKANILSQNPKTFQSGYAGSRQYQDNKIVVYDPDADRNEGKYVGLTDNLGNYFYIRYLEEIDIDIAPVENRSTSCDELQGEAPVRLVAWVKNGDFGKLAEVLIHDIIGTDFSTMTSAAKERFSGLQLYFTTLHADPEQIFKDETGSEEQDVRREKGVTLLALDFGIRFNYRIKQDDCIDRDICVGCTE